MCSALERLKRKRAEALVAFFPSDWGAGQLVHHCKLGCCSSPSHLRQRAWQIYAAVVFGGLPGIPSLKFWTRMRPCAAYFACGAGVGNVLTKALLSHFGPISQAPSTLVDDALTIPGDSMYHEIKGARAKKAVRFHRDPSSFARLVVGVVLVLPAEHFLFKQFDESARHSSSGGGAEGPRPLVDLASPSFSPAVATVKEYLEMLEPGHNPFVALGLGLNVAWQRRLRRPRERSE